MIINIALKGKKNYAIGGYKIMFEYANRLMERGHEVNILWNYKDKFKKWPFIYNHKVIKDSIIKMFYLGKKVAWFPVDDRIKQIEFIDGLRSKDVPDADIVIATAASSVEDVISLPDSKGKKCYFVQGVENWTISKDELAQTYRGFGLIIAISKWIKDNIFELSGEEAIIIPNGINNEEFYVTNAPKNRSGDTIAMLYHTHEMKGSRYGIEALNIVKAKYPNIKATIFGASPRPSDLPKWIKYIKNANHQQLLDIYNDSSIFLCPTINEGFGLTGAESMACGCALVSADYQAVHEYAVDGKNSLLCQVKNSESLASGIEELLLDNNKRIKLAEQGVYDIQNNLKWNNSVTLFENVLTEYCLS